VLAAPVATTPVGAPGTVDGTTGTEAAEAAPVPDTFVAVTVNVYDVPLVRPGTVHDVVADEHDGLLNMFNVRISK
jgi:hypothetical protein